LGEDPRVSDVSGVYDQFTCPKRIQHLGTHQSMCIGYQANAERTDR
jgi:hypothetical protein